MEVLWQRGKSPRGFFSICSLHANGVELFPLSFQRWAVDYLAKGMKRFMVLPRFERQRMKDFCRFKFCAVFLRNFFYAKKNCAIEGSRKKLRERTALNNCAKESARYTEQHVSLRMATARTAHFLLSNMTTGAAVGATLKSNFKDEFSTPSCTVGAE